MDDDRETDDYDSPRKGLIEGYFPDFMAWFFPQAHAGIDGARGYEFLDQELAQVTRDAAGNHGRCRPPRKPDFAFQSMILYGLSNPPDHDDGDHGISGHFHA